MDLRRILVDKGLIKEGNPGTTPARPSSIGTPISSSPTTQSSIGATSHVSPITTTVDPELKATVMNNIVEQDSAVFRAFNENVKRLSAMPQMKADLVLLLTTAAMTTPDATLVDIIQGARARVTACEAERQEFNRDRDAKLLQHVTGKESEITALDGEIQRANAALQELIAREQAKVNELQARKTALVEARAKAQAEIDKQTASFEAVFTDLLGQLNADATQITSILQSAPPTTGGTR